MRLLALLPLVLLLTALDASAQGIVIDRIIVEPTRPTPPPERHHPMRLVEHRFAVRIEDQVAKTEVVQVFHNPNPWPVEGIYLFPLPKGAAVSGFTMRMGDRDIPGEILDARKARDIYRSIVHRRRDPGLLEFAGCGLIRASLFPIPPRGETRVTLSYGQVLTPDAGLIEFVYPLRSDRFAPGPVRVSGEIDVRAQAGVATLFSPSHNLDVARKDGAHVLASFEETRAAADRDFRLLYSLGRKDFGLALSTYRPVGDDGYFLLLVAPPDAAQAADVMPKDIVFVLDTSGSMGDRGGQKLRQAKAALGYALGRLDGRDRFNVVAFATEARPFRDGVVPATKENVAAALEHVDGLQATGGTAIHDALAVALRLERNEGRVPIVIFLTDGQPTIGPTDPQTILGDAAKANGAQARLFVFGVGDDVNTILLSTLADDNRGVAQFVSEGEDIEIKVSSLYDKVASPVLTDVELKIADVGEYDIYPRSMGDLFRGQQVVVVGRYRAHGPRAITLRGRLGGRDVSYVYEATFGREGGQDFLPRLWAVRKVGFLLGEIRRNGEKQELVEEVRRLGIRHGIVTPYTSFLVVEESEMLRRRLDEPQAGGVPASPAFRAGIERRLRELEDEVEAADAAGEALHEAKAAGRGAVAGARLEGRYGAAERAEGHVGTGVKTVGNKTFRLIDGIWTDLDLEDFLRRHPQAERVTVAYLSEAYDTLLEDDTLARYLSVGSALRVVHDGRVIEIRDR